MAVLADELADALLDEGGAPLGNGAGTGANGHAGSAGSVLTLLVE